MATEAITLVQLDRSSAPDEDADLYYDVEFQNGQEAENLWFGLQTHNVPAGCQIWFHNLDGDLAIAIPPTTVTQNNFTVGTLVGGVPANYTCTIRVFLQLNGHPLPPDATVELVVYLAQLIGSATLRS